MTLSPLTVIYTCPICNTPKDITTKPFNSTDPLETCENCGHIGEIFNNMSTHLPSDRCVHADMEKDICGLFGQVITTYDCKTKGCYLSESQRNKILDTYKS